MVLTLGMLLLFFLAEARKHSAWLMTYLFCFLSQRGLCCVAQLRTLSEDCCANELSERSDGLHGTLYRTVCFLRDGSAAVDLCCYCRDFPLFVISWNGKRALLNVIIKCKGLVSTNSTKRPEPTKPSWYNFSSVPYDIQRHTSKPCRCTGYHVPSLWPWELSWFWVCLTYNLHQWFPTRCTCTAAGSRGTRLIPRAIFPLVGNVS